MDTVPPASLAQAPEAGPKYAYPPATKPIVNNIATKLLEDPRFYINVLHLMNKMDLPPPFTVKSLASEQPTMVTASMKTINLPSGPNIAPIARPIVEATVMTLVGSDHGGRQPSQGFSQQGQKRKQTDGLLASDESEVESEPDEEQGRKALVAKMMQDGVLSPDAKCHAHVGVLKDPPPKPVADGAAQRTLDPEDTKEMARMSGNAPPADDSRETTMDVGQETAHPKTNAQHVSSKLPRPSKDGETIATSGEKEESHELSKNVEAVSDQAQKEASENIHILNMDFKKTSRSDLVNIFAHYFEPNEAILE
ncbi:hypothetical protein BGZ74_010830 [Mortierella antarctica]|nr:hypothetical protein BGZ74_010830 [Mortierella antarctica]